MKPPETVTLFTRRRTAHTPAAVTRVAEMAAAAGVPSPAVMVLDSPVANVGAVGTSLEHATVLVSTGLLETLDRDETQAVVGHVVASVGNGDLRIGVRIASVFQTLGLVSIALGSSSSKSARRTAGSCWAWSSGAGTAARRSRAGR